MKLDKHLTQKINKKIIKFFLENPSSVDTSRGIATWINEDVDKTEKALKELVDDKILVLHGTGATSAYACTTDSYIISKLKICLKRSKK